MLWAGRATIFGPRLLVGERLEQKPRKFNKKVRKTVQLSDEGHLDRSSRLDYTRFDLELGTISRKVIRGSGSTEIFQEPRMRP